MASVALLPRPNLTTTSREVNEARRPHTCSRPCAFKEKRRKKSTKLRRNHTPRGVELVREVRELRWPHTSSRPAFEEKKRRKNTKFGRTQKTPETRPPRDDARRNTSHALAHTRPPPQIAGLWKSASYSSRLAISTNHECYTCTD